MKIAIISLLPDTGHITPLFKIAKILMQTGDTIKYFGPNETQQLALDYQIDSELIGNVRPENHQIALAKLSKSSPLLKNIIMSKWFYINYFEKIIFNGITHTDILQNLTKRFSPDLILCDSHLFITAYKKLAADLKLPLVVNDAMGSYFNHQHSLLYGEENFSPLKNTLLKPLKSICGKLYTLSVRLFFPKTYKNNELINKFIVEYWEQSASENLNAVKTMNISFGMGILEKKYLANEISVPNDVIQLGPLPIPPVGTLSTELNDWLNDSSLPPIIYIGFGTMIKGKLAFADDIISVIKKLGFRILWASPEKPWSNTKTSSDVMWENWVPQTKILAHPNVKLFITHAGSGAIQEAIWFAKPTICIPFLWDQHYNAWIVEKLNCGITIQKNKITKNYMADSILKALNLESNVAAMSQDFRNMESTYDIAEKIKNHAL